MQNINNKKYYTIKEAARELSVTTQTLRNWDNSGKFEAYRNPINRYRLYKPENIELLKRRIEFKKKRIFG